MPPGVDVRFSVGFCGGRLLPGRGRKRAGAAASYDGLHDAAQGALMLSVTVRCETMPLLPVRGVERDMPRGDAARIRAYAVGLVDDARAAGETWVTMRAGDVREALELDHRTAIIDICQALGTRKLQGEAGMELVARARAHSGPQLGIRVQARRRQGIAPDAGGGLARARGPYAPARRPPPFPAGASVCRGPGGSRGAEAGRGSARTHRPNVASSPGHRGLGGLRWETVRREGDGLGRSRLRALSRWTSSNSSGGTVTGKGEGGLCAIVIDVRQWLTCYHWLLPLVRPLRNWVASLSPRFSSLWRGQWQGEFKDSVY